MAVRVILLCLLSIVVATVVLVSLLRYRMWQRVVWVRLTGIPVHGGHVTVLCSLCRG